MNLLQFYNLRNIKILDALPKGHRFSFGVIKHRVCRNPNYYMMYIIIPLFLMVASAFSIFFIDYQDEDEHDGSPINLEGRLQVLVTLLLTVAAFQLQVGADLPFKEQPTLIDYYFLAAYFVLFVLISESSLAKAFTHYAHFWDIVFGSLCALLWTVQSLKFVLKWFTYEISRTHTSAEPSSLGCQSFSRLICCGFYGFCDAFSMCLYASFSGMPGVWREKKHHRRVQRWLRKERNESDRWNQGISEHERTAELVLGADWIPAFHKEAKGIRSYFQEKKATVERHDFSLLPKPGRIEPAM